MSDKIWAAAAERRDIKRHSSSSHSNHTVTVHKKMCLFGFWRKGQDLPSGRTKVYNSRRILLTGIHITCTDCCGHRRHGNGEHWEALLRAVAEGWQSTPSSNMCRSHRAEALPMPLASQHWSPCCSCVLQWGWGWHRRDTATQEELWNSLFLSPFSRSPAAGLSLVA